MVTLIKPIQGTGHNLACASWLVTCVALSGSEQAEELRHKRAPHHRVACCLFIACESRHRVKLRTRLRPLS